MASRYVLFAAGLAATAAPASAAVTVLGGSAARNCYLAAENRFTGPGAMGECDLAVRENLSATDRVATLVNRGILKLHFTDLDGALADFDKAIALDPAEAEAYLNKGMALLRLPKRQDEAIGQFDAALQKKTTKPAFAYYGRAIAHELNGRINQAYQDYRRASALDPKWGAPKKELARFSVQRQ